MLFTTLDDNTPPPEFHLDEIRREDFRGNANKKKLLSSTGVKLSHVEHGHTYSSESKDGKDYVVYDVMNSDCIDTLVTYIKSKWSLVPVKL